MIPRVLHFIWMQGLDDMPDKYRRCFESWELNNPGWRVVLWDRDKLRWVHSSWVWDVDSPTVQSDVIRMELVLRFGGVYLDCDMECVRPISGLVEGMDAFVSRRDERTFESTGFGATHGHPWMMDTVIALNDVRDRIREGLDIDAPFAVAKTQHPEVSVLSHRLLNGTRHGDRPEAYAYHHRFALWRERCLP